MCGFKEFRISDFGFRILSRAYRALENLSYTTEAETTQAMSTKVRNPKSEIRNPTNREISKHDQKLEFILRNAARIFAEKSYHSTSMRDISRATEVSLAGLYHYCKSKEELLFLIQDNCFGRVLERLEERLAGSDRSIQKLRIFIETTCRFSPQTWPR